MNSGFEIPDFEDMTRVTDKIQELGFKKLILENKIKSEEARIVREATTNVKYYVNSRTPSMAFIQATYLFTGFDGELIPLREELAQIVSELEHSKLTFKVYHDMVDVWRTQSANQRRSVS